MIWGYQSAYQKTFDLNAAEPTFQFRTTSTYFWMAFVVFSTKTDFLALF